MNNSFSPETEEAVIGSVLIDPLSYDDCAAHISSTDFNIDKHKWLWSAFATLAEQGQPIDTLTVTNILDARGQLNDIGGTAYLTQMLLSTPTSANAEHYARLIADKSQRRRLFNAANEIARLAADETRDASKLVGEAINTISEVARPGSGEIFSQSEAVGEWYQGMAQYIQEGKITGLTTGYSKIDRKVNGIRRGELVIIAARPSMGKTSLAAQMSVRQAREGLRVGVFTLEITKRAWVEASALAELGIDKMTASDKDLERIIEKCTGLHTLPISYYERGQSQMIEIERQARNMARALGGLDVIYLDHLGYIDHAAGGRVHSLPYSIGQSTKRLASLAKEYNAAVVCICQMSRESAKSGVEPQLTDLRDSGEIEQDGRQVWFIHRPGYYADPEPPADKPQEASILVRKNHEGPTGKITMAFIKSCRRFAEML